MDYQTELDHIRFDDTPEDGGRASAPARQRARRTPRRHQRGAAEAAPRTALDQYLRSLQAPRVLSKQETFALARQLEAERQSFLEELRAVPGTAVRLLERWHQRRERGHVTAALSARFRDGSGRDRSPQIDRALRRLERLLARWQALDRRSDARERAALEQQLARALRSADIAFEVMQEIFKELSELSGAPRSRANREARRRLGLDEAGQRARLERARSATERMDRVKQTFVIHNARLVVKQAKRFRNMGVPYLDLIQEGNLGLIRAVEKFDYRLGYRFSTYAVWWIDQAMVRAVQNASRTVRVPTHVYDLEIRARRVRAELHTRLGRAPTHEELAAQLEVSPEEVKRAATSMQPIASTQATLPGTEEFTLEETLADPDAVDPTESIDQREIGLRLGRQLAGLGPRERTILEARFGLGGGEPQKLQEIGQTLGLSRERVRQIEARALARLRHGAREEGLEELLEASA